MIFATCIDPCGRTSIKMHVH